MSLDTHINSQVELESEDVRIFFICIQHFLQDNDIISQSELVGDTVSGVLVDTTVVEARNLWTIHQNHCARRLQNVMLKRAIRNIQLIIQENNDYVSSSSEPGSSQGSENEQPVIQPQVIQQPVIQPQVQQQPVIQQPVQQPQVQQQEGEEQD